MAQFTYIARASSGELASGVLSARDRHDALRRVLGLGYHPVDVRDAGSGAAQRGRASVSNAEVAAFSRRLGALLRAGLAMVPALRAVREQLRDRAMIGVVQDMIVRIEHDASGLSEAMASHPRVFDPVYQGLVRSGELSGQLKTSLDEAADYLTHAHRLRLQVRNATIYPAVLTVAGVASVVALMTSVVPRFKTLFESFGQQLPLPTRVLIDVSTFCSAWWWAVLLAAGALVLAVWSAMRRPSTRLAIDRALLHAPIVGDVLMKIEIARLARTLAQLLGARVPLLEALRLSSKVCRNHALRATFGPLAAGVSDGRPLAACMAEAGVYPSMMLAMVRTGEQTGQLPGMLRELGEMYEHEAEHAVSGAVKLLEPVLIVSLGAVVAGIVAAIMLPVFSASALVS